MSKLNQEELLNRVTHWRKSLHKDYPSLQLDWTKKDEQACQQIREMIQAYAQCQEIKADYMNMIFQRDLLQAQLEKKKPEVTEEWIERWNQVIAERVNVQMKKDFIREEISLVYPGTENLTQMLKEVGVEVVGIKEEKRQGDNSKD